MNSLSESHDLWILIFPGSDELSYLKKICLKLQYLLNNLINWHKHWYGSLTLSPGGTWEVWSQRHLVFQRISAKKLITQSRWVTIDSQNTMDVNEEPKRFVYQHSSKSLSHTLTRLHTSIRYPRSIHSFTWYHTQCGIASGFNEVCSISNIARYWKGYIQDTPYWWYILCIGKRMSSEYKSNVPGSSACLYNVCIITNWFVLN